MIRKSTQRVNMSRLPEWMIQSDNYIPEKDSDSYVKKSIIKLKNIMVMKMVGGFVIEISV